MRRSRNAINHSLNQWNSNTNFEHCLLCKKTRTHLTTHLTTVITLVPILIVRHHPLYWNECFRTAFEFDLYFKRKPKPPTSSLINSKSIYVMKSFEPWNASLFSISDCPMRMISHRSELLFTSSPQVAHQTYGPGCSLQRWVVNIIYWSYLSIKTKNEL